MDLSHLFTTFGLDLGAVVAIATAVYGGIAVLRSELPASWTKGWKSRAMGGVLALALAYAAEPLAGLVPTVMTGVASWVTAMLPHKMLKGTKLEIPRNGTKKG